MFWLAPLLAATLGLPTPPPSTIAGGSLALPCQFSAVVSYRAGEQRCTGVLVHPRVMLTAAHCVEQPPSEVRFGEAFSPDEGRRAVESCTVAPGWDEEHPPAEDFAYCVLEQPYEDLPVALALSRCESSQLRAGATTMLVGYGVTETGASFGTKRYVLTRAAEDPRSDGLISIGDASANGCIGDSGGPAYLQLEDGSWRVLGVSALTPGCGEGPSTYVTVQRHIDWVATQTQLDLRPCRDDEGAWADSSACAGAQADPRDRSAPWGRSCALASAPSTGCDENESSQDSTGSTSAASSSGDSSDADSSGSRGSSDSSGSSSSPAGIEDSSSDGGCGCRGAGQSPPVTLLVWMWLGWVLRRRWRPDLEPG